MPILPNATMAEYLALPALSSSGARRILRSPAHYQYAADDNTKALRDGTITHAALLESAEFASRYQEAPEGDRRYKEVKKAWEDALADAAANNRTLITKNEMEMVRGIRSSLWAIPTVATLVSRSQRELTITFERSLVPCRARLDMFFANENGRQIVADLKTTEDARPHKFMKSVESYGYAVQAAWYLRAADEAFGVQPRSFVWIVVEKEPPYAGAIYIATREWIEEGQREMDEALRIYRECSESKRWPAYNTSFQALPFPSWKKKNDD